MRWTQSQSAGRATAQANGLLWVRRAWPQFSGYHNATQSPCGLLTAIARVTPCLRPWRSAQGRRLTRMPCQSMAFDCPAHGIRAQGPATVLQAPGEGRRARPAPRRVGSLDGSLACLARMPCLARAVKRTRCNPVARGAETPKGAFRKHRRTVRCRPYGRSQRTLGQAQSPDPEPLQGEGP